jgi:hypothetical protein
MDWRAIHSVRPEERKRVARKTRMLLPLTNDAIRKHLTGKQTIGIYPLLPDEMCWLLAVDLDKKSWIADAAGFLETCRRFHVQQLSRARDDRHRLFTYHRYLEILNRGTELPRTSSGGTP